MWPTYSVSRRKSSAASSVRPQPVTIPSVQYSSALVESPISASHPFLDRSPSLQLDSRTHAPSPPLSAAPQTPQREMSLSKVEEDTPQTHLTDGSRVPLLSAVRVQSPLPPLMDDGIAAGAPAGGPGRDRLASRQDARTPDHEASYPSHQTLLSPDDHDDTTTRPPQLKLDDTFERYTFDSDSEPASPPLPKDMPRQLDPSLLPPPAPHDTYLSHFFRPAIARSSSAPIPAPLAPSQSQSQPLSQTAEGPTTPGKLLPSPLGAAPMTPGQSDSQPKDRGEKTIYEIFDAALSPEGDSMVHALKDHLDAVLKVQEEIGRMHLALENLQSPDMQGKTGRRTWREDEERTEGLEGLKRREKGVDDIMNKLSIMSEELRTYHQLGTPRLAFPQPDPRPLRHPSNAAQPGLPTSSSNPKIARAYSAVDQAISGLSGSLKPFDVLGEERPAQAPTS